MMDKRIWIGTHAGCGGRVFDCEDGKSWWTECEKCHADTRRGDLVALQEKKELDDETR